MTDLALDFRGGRSPARGLAVAVSAVAHALALLALFWRLGAAPTYQEPSAMNVQLTPWPQTVRRSPPIPVKTQRASAKALPRPSIPPVLSRPAVGVQETAPVVKPSPSGGETARVREALRRLGGCRHAALLDLSPSEREACLDQLAKAPGDGPTALNLDRHGYAAGKNRDPYLARKPKNGCKIGAGGDTTPSGEQGAAGGIGCAWSF